MSEEDDILNKMDALLKRHQTASATPNEIPMLNEVVAKPAASETAPVFDVPVLTSVVETGAPQPGPLSEPELEAPAEELALREEIKSHSEVPVQLNDAAMEQLLRVVDQHVSQMLLKNLAPQLISSLDRSVSAMMVQFNSHIEELVRDAITSELQKYLDNFVVDLIETTAKAAPDASNTSSKGDSV